MFRPYYNLDVLKDVYFEDSYVTGFHERGDSFVFDLVLILKEDHKFFSNPKKGEMYCYRDARLVFSEIYDLRWLTRKNSRSRDKTGSVDFGNIDNFIYNNAQYNIVGDWGEVAIYGGKVNLEIF